MSSNKLKIHRFTDCDGFGWRTSEEERSARSTKDLHQVTCGTCKQRILSVIADSKWSELDLGTLRALDRALAVHFLRVHDAAAVELVKSDDDRG